MKKNLILSCLLMIISIAGFAQGATRTDPSDATGLDVTSILIGLVVGLGIGFFVGRQMGGK